jgi:hypothetical protein
MTYVWDKPQTAWQRQIPAEFNFIAVDPAGMTYGYHQRPKWGVKSGRWLPADGDTATALGLIHTPPGDMASSTMQERPAKPAVPRVKPEPPPDRVVPEGGVTKPAPAPAASVQQTVTPSEKRLTDLAASAQRLGELDVRRQQLDEQLAAIRAAIEAEKATLDRLMMERYTNG